MKMTTGRKIFAVYGLWQIVSVVVTGIIVFYGSYEPTLGGLMDIFAAWMASAFLVGLYMAIILAGIGFCWMVVKSLE